MSFYKTENDTLLTAPTAVHGPGYTLQAESHAEHTYPVDGWWWFDTLADAMAALSKPQPVSGVPQAVTMRQARLALLGAGVLASVDAAINAMPEPTRSAAKIEWEYSGEVQRHNGFVAALGPALGMTDEQMDALFIAAAKL